MTNTMRAQVNAIPFSQSIDTFQYINGTIVDAPMKMIFFMTIYQLGLILYIMEIQQTNSVYVPMDLLC